MRFAFLISSFALAGCMSGTEAAHQATIGHVGCPPSEIQIRDQDGPHWTASCRGQTYYCAKDIAATSEQAMAGYEGTGAVTCTPAAK